MIAPTKKKKLSLPSATARPSHAISPQHTRIDVAAQLLSARIVASENVIEIKIIDIVEDSPFQTRGKFDPDNNEDDLLLVESIRAHGQVEPAGVHKLESSKYGLVWGHRRRDALIYLQATTIRAILWQGDLHSLADRTAIENFGKPLNAPEKMELVMLYTQHFNMNPKDISSRVGVSERSVFRYKAIHDSDITVRAAFEQQCISLRVAELLAAVPADSQKDAVEIVMCNRRAVLGQIGSFAKLLSDSQSVEQAARASNLVLPSEATEDDMVAAGNDANEVIEPGASKKAHNTGSPKPKKATAKDYGAYKKTLKRELTTIDSAVIDAAVRKGNETRASLAEMRTGILLSQRLKADDAFDTASQIKGDPTARLASETLERIGRMRAILKSKRANGYASELWKGVAKELAALNSEISANKK